MCGIVRLRKQDRTEGYLLWSFFYARNGGGGRADETEEAVQTSRLPEPDGRDVLHGA